VGAAGGLLSGLLGVGGGLLMVPLLIALAGMDQRRAATTSLVAIVPTALAGSVNYLAHGEADLRLAAVVAVGGVAGSWLGTWLLRRTPVAVLRWLFVGFLLLVALRMVLVEPVRAADLHLTAGTFAALLGIGVLMGLAAGMFGVGGGVVVVPALVVLGVGDLLARGTSLLVMVPTSTVGTIANVRARAVDLQTGLIVGGAATVASTGGVALAFALPARTAALLYALLLVVSAVQLALRAVRLQRRGR
jgi:uncharacterized membrane protein YfcA